MSALASNIGQQTALSNYFSAHLALAAGVSVSINAPTLDELGKVVAKLQPAANEPKVNKQAPASSPTPEAAAGNAPASTPAPAGAPAANGGSEQAGDEKRPTYDDVRDRVLKLAKVSRDTATQALAKFGVDHGNKLKLEQYPAFLAHADEVLKAAANA